MNVSSIICLQVNFFQISISVSADLDFCIIVVHWLMFSIALWVGDTSKDIAARNRIIWAPFL